MADSRCGIYQIRHLASGKCYVGSSRRLIARFAEHRLNLERNQHRAKHLQAAWNKYGADAFEFHIIEECQPALLIEREQYYIDTLPSEYNYAKAAGSRAGVPQPLSAVAASSAARMGKPLSAEHKRRVGDGNRGKERTPELRARYSALLKGKPSYARTAETLEKNRLAATGRKASPEARAKQRAAKLGKKQDPATIAKRIAAYKITVAKRKAQQSQAEPLSSHSSDPPASSHA